MWRFAEARTIGTSHIRANMPCQDRCACEVLTEGILVAAVADGAGSAVMAERGAALAVDSVIAYVKRALEDKGTDFEGILRKATEFARKAIAEEAEREGNDFHSYASTLLAVVLTPEGGAAVQIGDGVIVVNDGCNDWEWVFWPQRGEYVNTTRFLTEDDAIGALESKTFSNSMTDIALMSDGLEPLALHYGSKTAHSPFFTGMFTPLWNEEGCAAIDRLSRSLEVFLSSKGVVARTDDDVSLILATCRGYGQSI